MLTLRALVSPPHALHALHSTISHFPSWHPPSILTTPTPPVLWNMTLPSIRPLRLRHEVKATASHDRYDAASEGEEEKRREEKSSE
eukprot:766760-Hanusia_phi.AAC.3